MSKLIFLDVDGTLVDYQGNLPASAVEAIKQAQAAGNLVFLCTGRSMADAVAIRDAVNADGVIGGGGAYIEDGGETLFHCPIPEQTEREVVDWLTERGRELVVETNVGMFGSDGFPKSAQSAAAAYRDGIGGFDSSSGTESVAAYPPAIAALGLSDDDGVKRIHPDIVVGESLYRSDANKVSFLLESPDDVFAAHEAFPELRVASWGGKGEQPLFAEVSVGGIDKATAIKTLVRHRGADMADTIGFGDAAADIPMIDVCETGVAMAGGGREARGAADYIADDVDNNGLIRAFRQLGLLTLPDGEENHMQTATGKSVLKGVAMGPLRVYKTAANKFEETSKLTAPEEWKRFNDAVEVAQKQLDGLYEKALKEAGEETAAIFEVHKMMLEDDDYIDSVKTIIATQNATAEYAVNRTGENQAAIFAEMDDEYMSARAADIRDISKRVVDVLTGGGMEDIDSDRPFILVADDLTPSETVQLDKSKLLGFVTRHGSKNSHTAILARTMNIPALIDVDYDESWDGKEGILDGYSATLYVDPDEEVKEKMLKRFEEDKHQAELLQTLKKKRNITKDGVEIKVFANIGNVSDVGLALQNDAQGIGLFRTEFIYLDSPDFPTEEQQFDIYKRVVETMGGKKVIIRTLDLGADKQAPYFRLDKEENPAMGYRAIRICLTHPEIFKPQLKAILRAAPYGMVSVMFPMITSVSEVERAKEILNECREELEEAGERIGAVEVGIMIETPAAVMMADELADEVDFFSIGTNDLTQYTLAIDRQNDKLDEFFDPHSPALLRMIQHVVDAGHRHGCWVGICGELGADQELTETFMRMGVDELSVSPGQILPLRHTIRNLDLSDGEKPEAEMVEIEEVEA